MNCEIVRSGFTFCWHISLSLSPSGLLPGFHFIILLHHEHVFLLLYHYQHHQHYHNHHHQNHHNHHKHCGIIRFSPHEWANPHPCVDTGFVVQNDFTLANRFRHHSISFDAFIWPHMIIHLQ